MFFWICHGFRCLDSGFTIRAMGLKPSPSGGAFRFCLRPLPGEALRVNGSPISQVHKGGDVVVSFSREQEGLDPEIGYAASE